MASTFELLMELPLFKGVSLTTISNVVGAAKFHFLKYPAGETIIREKDACTHLTFVIAGSVRLTLVNANGRFAVNQTLTAPAVIAPDFLFGRVTTYPCTVEALDDVSILKISKIDYTNILTTDPVFLFNYLNTLSVNAQKSVDGIMSLTTGEIDERIAFWIIALTQPGSTDIRLSCRKRDLCSLFGVPRTVFNNGLESMKKRGLIDYNNNELMVNDRTAMLDLLLDTHE
ncbi:MAG: Crp/Fnr family transcriptional regulator [Muribaculaceae bacterium]|nr:Crp/Fnr family transcriptional regulator [Muribaculaceae bacterium]